MKNHKVPPRKVFRTLSKLSYTLGSALLIASLAFNFIPVNQQNALAAIVTPTLTDDDTVSCKKLGYQYGFKIDPPKAGMSSDGKLSVTITFTAYNDSNEPIKFNWYSNIGVDAVIAKGGNTGANIYVYDPESTGDTNLQAPNNPNGKPAGLSHIEFCYDIEPATSTPTSTSTNTPTNTPTHTPETPTNTPTNTPETPTNTPTNTPETPTNTPTNTPETPTNTPTNTPETPTNTPTNTPETPTNTPTNTPETPTNTPETPTNTPETPTNTPVTPTETPEVPTETPEVPTSTPELPTPTIIVITEEVTPTPTTIIFTETPVTETPVTETPVTPTDPGETPSPPPTAPPPAPTNPPQVLIPVTGADLSVPTPLNNLQSTFGNLGLALLGVGLVLQGISRRLEDED